MDKNIGRKLDGRYEITELIGIGGMADVYKAVDLAENRTVAVKILKNEFADNDDFVRRFRNESKAIAVLSHPNIVKIYDVGFSDKIQFIVMEYIDGITLKEFMEQQGVLKWKDSVHFIIQILRALQHAHDRGIVHRDIKPQNIMLFPDGTIKVMDFGIARFAREEGKTISDKAIGSVHYISPEQARGDITDEKSDIYSVGVMLYEMLTGVKPFDADTPIAVALMHMQNVPKAPRQINNTIPEGLEGIVIRAMQREPAKRYQSASEMIKDIEEFKLNPSIVFEYRFPAENAPGEEKTQYFDRPAAVKSDKDTPKSASDRSEGEHKKAAANEVRKTKPKKTKEEVYQNDEYDDYDDDEDDEDEEVSKSSYFVVALTAIAAAVVIIAMVFIAVVIINNFVGDKTTDPMVDLRGHDYQYCKTYYAEYFTLVVDSEKYDAEIPKGCIISHSPKEGAPIVRGSTEVKAVVSKGPQMVPVPNVYQIEANTATSMINGSGLKVSIVMQNSDAAKNTVIKTDPERNTEVVKDSTVILYVSLGPEIYDVIMPNVVGMERGEAAAKLEGMGFTVTLEVVDSAQPANEIVEQSIPPLDADGKANIVRPDQTVILSYSSGKAPVQALNLTFAVPSDLKGKAVFTAYVGGNAAGTTSIDNIGYVSTVSIPVEGTDTQKTVVEVADDKGNTEILGEYNIDFNTKMVSEVRFDKEVLTRLFGKPEPPPPETLPPGEIVLPPEETVNPWLTEPGETAFSDPFNDPAVIDNGNYEDWWNNIINSY